VGGIRLLLSQKGLVLSQKGLVLSKRGIEPIVCPSHKHIAFPAALGGSIPVPEVIGRWQVAGYVSKRKQLA